MRNGFPASFKQGADSGIKGWRSGWALSRFANADALGLVSAGGASPGHQRLRLGRWTLEPSSAPSCSGAVLEPMCEEAGSVSSLSFQTSWPVLPSTLTVSELRTQGRAVTKASAKQINLFFLIINFI